MSTRTLSIDAPLAFSPYPERMDTAASGADVWARAVLARLAAIWAPPVAREVQVLARAMTQQRSAWARASDAELRAQVQRDAGPAVHRLRRANLHQALLGVAEIANRTLGLRPYPTQLAGAATLLRGHLAEMQTGEGKTLTAGLAACLAGVAGVPVHVVTVNDYLAQRDARLLEPLLTFMGLRVGAIVHDIDPAARRAIYARDVAYCTNKELVFDYLRDRVAAGGRASAAQVQARALFGVAGASQPMLRGLHLAIIDEADSILIDEARTPLILAESAGPTTQAQPFGRALQLAAGLHRPQHFAIDAARRTVELTSPGRARIAELSADDGGPWRATHVREHLVMQALRAVHLFAPGQQYLVDAECKLQIVDEYTGRVLPGRSWEEGLQQMIEAKEGIGISAPTHTRARITYQRFFARYLRLGGMTGTAREMAREFAGVYRLRTVPIPPHRPCVRQRLPDRVCVDEAQKWQAVAEQVLRWHRDGRPVLVGTRSVEASERLSAVLTSRGLAHRVLNARQDEDEAAIVARAGQRGAITVATNIAGRGTDIELAPGIAACGGLGVVLTEFHESPRIDRQLFGRCARQGDPGTCAAIVALDDSLFAQHLGGKLKMPSNRALPIEGLVSQAWIARRRRRAQARAERLHARTRRDALQRDRDLDRLLAFSGDPL